MLRGQLRAPIIVKIQNCGMTQIEMFCYFKAPWHLSLTHHYCVAVSVYVRTYVFGKLFSIQRLLGFVWHMPCLLKVKLPTSRSFASLSQGEAVVAIVKELTQVDTATIH